MRHSSWTSRRCANQGGSLFPSRVGVAFFLSLILVLATACGETVEPDEEGEEGDEATAETAEDDNGAAEDDDGDDDDDDEAAEDYPSRTITFIQHSDVGSTLDNTTRTLASVWEPLLGERFEIVSVPGGAGLVAMARLKEQAPDGYTIHMTSASMTAALNNQVAKEEDVSLDDFTPIAKVVDDPNIIVVPADSPLGSWEDFERQAREDPGSLTVGGAQAGAIHHTTLERLMAEIGGEVTWVPFQGAGEASTQVQGGHVDAGFFNAQPVAQAIEEGELRVLATTGDERNPAAPDAPTLKEEGVDFVAYNWRGIQGPAGLSSEVMDVLISTLEEAIRAPEWQEFLESGGQTPSLVTGEEFEVLLREETEAVGAIMQELGLE